MDTVGRFLYRCHEDITFAHCQKVFEGGADSIDFTALAMKSSDIPRVARPDWRRKQELRTGMMFKSMRSRRAP